MTEPHSYTPDANPSPPPMATSANPSPQPSPQPSPEPENMASGGYVRPKIFLLIDIFITGCALAAFVYSIHTNRVLLNKNSS